MVDTRKIFGVEIPISEPLVITLDDKDGDGIPSEGDDFTKDVKQKLVDHVSVQTKLKNSPYITNKIVESSITDTAGFPSPLSDNNSSASSTFQKELTKTQDGQNAVSSFDQISNSGLLDGIDVKKGRENSNKPSFDTLLADVNANKQNSKISVAVRKSKLENNDGINDENEYIDRNESKTEEELGVGTIKIQPTLGTYLPKKFPNTPDGSQVSRLKVSNLKNLGLQMLLEASGEYFIPEDTDNFAQVVISKAATTAPGLARMGIKIPLNRFSATEIAKQVNPNFEKQSKFPQIKGNPIFSYGSVNNPLVPFNGSSATSSKAAAILLATTVGILLKSLAELLGENGYDEPDSLKEESKFGTTRKDRLGSYLGKEKQTESSEAGFNLGSIGLDNFNPLVSNGKNLLIRTRHDYTDAVNKGIEEFFGKGPSDNPILNAVAAPLGAAANAVGLEVEAYKNLTESHGYYNVILRMLIRSTTDTILGAINSVAGTIGSISGNGSETFLERAGVVGDLDYNPQIGLDADPTNILNVIDSIRNSKLLKFANVMASLGDIVLLRDESGVSYEDNISDLLDNSDTKYKSPNPAALIRVNRLSDAVGARYKQKLSWGSSTLRSMYMMPKKTINASAAHLNDAGKSFSTMNLVNYKDGYNGRLKQEDVDAIEQELEAYYMPFYFHDLRTNEIISFHAFIENITDQYQVEYTENQMFGRIGKTMNYKNTNRDIGCSFRVVSTNKQDFYEMWHKINKLVMMVYPQYTAGREITTSDNKKFIQPFSQLISNSPLIRFRLGDLIKTNFSELDIKRLFGLGTIENNAAFDVKSINPRNLAKNEKIESILNYNLDTDDQVWVLNPPSYGGPVSRHSVLKIKPDGKNQLVPLNYSGKLLVRVVRPIENNSKTYQVSPVDPGIKFGGILYADFSRQTPGIAIEPDSNTLFSDALNAVDENVLGNEEDEFFKLEKNPIMKAFDSVRGEGLPGFIKSIAFDWSDARWETEDINDRAPMWCKIDIAFSPIMEVSPGLDSNGEMIGAPYNIGAIMSALKAKKSKNNVNKQNSYGTSIAKTNKRFKK